MSIFLLLKSLSPGSFFLIDRILKWVIYSIYTKLSKLYHASRRLYCVWLMGRMATTKKVLFKILDVNAERPFQVYYYYYY